MPENKFACFLKIKVALLQALLDGEGYGLDLIDRVANRTKGKVKLQHDSVYPALRALEREGLVMSWDGEPVPETGGRPRRYYELTAEGLRCAREQRESLCGLLSPTWEASR
jgi:PadR family transcriptional regulator PadR